MEHKRRLEAGFNRSHLKSLRSTRNLAYVPKHNPTTLSSSNHQDHVVTADSLTLGMMLRSTAEEIRTYKLKASKITGKIGTSENVSELPKMCRNFRGVGASYVMSELLWSQNLLHKIRTSYKFWAQQTAKIKSKFDQTTSKLHEI